MTKYKFGIRLSILLSCIALLAATASCHKVQKITDKPQAQSMEELRDAKVSVVLGSLQEILMPDVGAEIMRLNSVSDLLLSVEKGTSDYLLSDSVSFLGLDLDSLGLRVAFTDDFCCGDACIAFRPEDKELCADYNEFLASIKQDGTFAEMVERWTEGNPAESEMPESIVLPEEGEPLIIGTMHNYPFTFIKNNEWVGFETEMMYRFCARIGRPAEIVNYDFAALAPALTTGKIDVICAFIFNTEERAKVMLFSDPYFHSTTACVGSIPGHETENSDNFRQTVKKSFTNNFIAEDRWQLIVKGLYETLLISFFSLLLGTLLGGLICLMKIRGGKFLKGVAKVYIDIMQGVPILVLLMIMFYVVFASGGLSARWVAVIAFGLNLAANVSEMMSSAIAGVERGQTEAGLAMGFSRISTFINFVLPQALKRMLPVYRGEAISLIKSTSIVGYIAIQDLTKMSDIIRARTFDAFFPLIMVSIIYFLIAWLLGRLLDAANKKLK